MRADALLASLEEEHRGKLKVFLGAAPGVGKTYAMLQAVREQAREGVDILIGVALARRLVGSGVGGGPRAIYDHRRLMRELVIRLCAACGAFIGWPTPNQQYCSPKCRKAANRPRSRLERDLLEVQRRIERLLRELGAGKINPTGGVDS